MNAQHHGMNTPGEILNKALEKEMQARDFYGELALGCRVIFVRELLEKLQNEEDRHVRMIQQMLSRLASGKDIA